MKVIFRDSLPKITAVANSRQNVDCTRIVSNVKREMHHNIEGVLQLNFMLLKPVPLALGLSLKIHLASSILH